MLRHRGAAGALRILCRRVALVERRKFDFVATASCSSSSSKPEATGSGNSLATASPSSAATVEPEKSVKSIEDILIESRRKELIERVGPHVERYLPTEDPNAFLLPASRLEPAERTWQKVFVALPWAVFACMLAAPLLLVKGNLPFLQKRAEEERQAAERRASAIETDRVPHFQIVNFGQMPDVLERPFPTILFLFDSATYSSKVFLPAIRDVERLLREAGIPVGVAALDLTASPLPPDSFMWEYPSAMSPHFQLVMPRATDGEAGVVDYDGRWSAAGLAAAASRLAGPRMPDVAREKLQQLDMDIEKLRDLLFELMFLDDGAPAEVQASWWRRWGGDSKDVGATAASADRRSKALRKFEDALDADISVSAAIASCQLALAELNGEMASDNN
eukprot:TRINITY_DN92609_c0_g1_i1.p1 TRINITY_DN92609_c0_g1~~TRINITY_DN92609_c0_g1_i1.p1  ORF type:complete len:392 (-),score=80.32 TRINITY_DN92609_c0_g1_i1:31-1206(-)